MEGIQVMRAVRSRLMKRIFYLSPVLELVEWREQRGFEGIGTDGRYLFFGPDYVVRMAEKKQSSWLEREYLQAVCHIICGHPSGCPQNPEQAEIFDVSADLKADELSLKLIEGAGGRRHSGLDTAALLGISRVRIDDLAVEQMSVRELYCNLRDSGIGRDEVLNVGIGNRGDDHRFWRHEADSAGASAAAGSAGPATDRRWLEQLDKALIAMQIMAGRKASCQLFGDRGSGRGSFGITCYYEAAGENRRSYREFLERYLALEEVCREDDSEIDYIWYTYGMDRWGNIPLIESPEVTCQPVLKQIAIAIDTSGSCQGDLIRQFLRETSNILRSYENMEMDILIFQADASICREDRVTNIGALDRYIADGRVAGGGGTSFVPVISRLEALGSADREDPFRLLIYLSDGMGEFPEKKPDFDVAFVLPDDDSDVRLPEWVLPFYIDVESSHGGIPAVAPQQAGSSPKGAALAAAAQMGDNNTDSSVSPDQRGGAGYGLSGFG